MNLWTKIKIIGGMLKWRLTWENVDTHFVFTVPDNPKFMGARDAVKKMIRDGDMIAVSGLGGNQHATVIFWALRKLYEETGHPKNLTALSIGGQGGRGKVPGTFDEVAIDGLCTRFITGHVETFKNALELAEMGKMELQCLPQGTLALLIDAQARGEKSVLVNTGVSTVFDPSIGRGTPLCGDNAEQWVEREGDMLRYRMPEINVGIFNAPAADRNGNIYMKDCPMIAEIPELTQAVKRNGGKVIATVGLMVEEGYGDIFVKAEDVDAVVYHPKTGQSMSRPYSDSWSLVTTESDIDIREGYLQMKFVNDILKVTPRRTPVDQAMARLAASVFAENAWKGVLVNIGTGLPEKICEEVFEGGLLKDITFFTESGVVGGIPGPGVFFGAAACPESMVSSTEIFKRAHRELDFTMLGILQVDSEGNVNVSKRGEGPLNYVGPGGFIDFSTSAKVVIFIGSWMAHSTLELHDGQVRIVKVGSPKFIEKVDEITFSGKEALKAGRRVFYVTPVGLFRLTERGVQLERVMPGIDVQKDIIDFAPANICLPESGEVPVVAESIVTGSGFRLKLTGQRPTAV